MNFKTILSISALALLSAVNSAPINSTQHAHTDEFIQIREQCHSHKGMLTYDHAEKTYACLQRLFPEEEFKLISPEESVCFYLDKTKFCINSQYTNIEECDKSSEKFNEEYCLRNFIIGPIEVKGRIRSYPDKKKIISSHEIDHEECVNTKGLFLVENTKSYICLDYNQFEPYSKGKHCVTTQKTESSEIKYYCVDEENTTIDICNNSSESYNSDECMKKIEELSKDKDVNITYYW